MSKYWFPSMGSWLIQLTVLLLTILYFSDPLKKKISTFLILICILAVSENIAATFALPIYTLIHHEESFRYNLLYTSGEMLFLIIIDFFVALLFIKKLVPLIRNYSHSIQLTTIAELLFPVQASSLLVGILLYRKNSPWLKWLIILYWFLNLLCCLIIARAFHNISVREKKTRTVGSADELSSETAGIYNRNGTGISICAKMESRYGKPSFFTELSDPRKKIS